MKRLIFLTIPILILVLISINKIFVFYVIDIRNTCSNGTTLAAQKFIGKAVKRTEEEKFRADSVKNGDCFKKTNLQTYIFQILGQNSLLDTR